MGGEYRVLKGKVLVLEEVVEKEVGVLEVIVGVLDGEIGVRRLRLSRQRPPTPSTTARGAEARGLSVHSRKEQAENCVKAATK